MLGGLYFPTLFCPSFFWSLGAWKLCIFYYFNFFTLCVWDGAHSFGWMQGTGCRGSSAWWADLHSHLDRLSSVSVNSFLKAPHPMARRRQPIPSAWPSSRYPRRSDISKGPIFKKQPIPVLRKEKRTRGQHVSSWSLNSPAAWGRMKIWQHDWSVHLLPYLHLPSLRFSSLLPACLPAELSSAEVPQNICRQVVVWEGQNPRTVKLEGTPNGSQV